MKRAVGRLALAAALACTPGATRADPVTLAALAATYVGVPIVATAIVIAANVYGGIDARRRARHAAQDRRNAYNASLTDRNATALGTIPPWRVIYGRATRSGGDIVAIFTSDKTATAEDGTSYTKPDALKHMVVVVAAHEVEAIHDVYIDGVQVGALDGSGAPTGGAFVSTKTDSRTVVFTDSVALSETPIAVLGAYSTSGTGADVIDTPETVTIAGSTLNGPAGVQVTANYTVAPAVSTVRIQKHLGSDSQTVDTYLNGLLPTKWEASDRLQGNAYVVVTLDLEDARFQGGPPDFKFDVSGRKVYDPRTGLTAWSANTALCTRDWLMAPWGYSVAAADMNDASVIAAANACDATINLTVGGVTTTGPTYTCNGSISTDASRESTLEDLVESMAGYAVYGAQWRLLAGVWTAPVMDLTDADLFGQIEVVQAGAGVDELFNGLRGTMISSGDAQPTDADPYQNATFVAADGVEMWSDATLPFTDNRARARNLFRIFVERARSSQVIRYPAKLRAWPLEVGDRVTVTNAELGLVAKTYRVTDWQFGITTPVLLTLQEDVPATYDLADAATADPSPNTDLPDPFIVSAVTGLAAASGTSQLVRTADGTIDARVLVSWNAVADAYVADGSGRIELLWRRPRTLAFRSQTLPGDATSGWIDDAKEGEQIILEVRAVNGLRQRGPSVFLAHTVVGKTALPANVAGLAATALPGGVGVSWTPNTEADYSETEVRYGASWAAGTLIYVGPADRFTWPWPTAGSYTLRAKHRDTSGNESAADATQAVTVGNGNLIPTGGLQPGSATTVVSSSVTSVTVTQQIGAPAGTLIASVSVTPTRDCEILVTASGHARTDTAASGSGEDFASMVAQLEVFESVGGAVTIAEAYQLDGKPGFSTTVRHAVNQSKRFAAVGGTAYTIRSRGLKLNSGATCVIEALELRAEAILA